MLNMLFMQSSGKQECHCRKKRALHLRLAHVLHGRLPFINKACTHRDPTYNFFNASSDSSLISFLFLS